MSYLDDLTLRMLTGLAAAPDERKQRHADYILKLQRPDGGWAGREGGSDLYYTGFALRSLMMLGKLYGEPAKAAKDFLRGRLGGRESIVDFLSLIYGGMLLRMSGNDPFMDAGPNWQAAVATALEELRRPDGGYAKGPEGAASSTYHTFLVLLCLQLLQAEIREPERIVAFLLSQRAEEGGFREIRASKRAGTNPTAAAIGALRILSALTDEIRQSTIDFLAEMQTDEGGLRANTRIPIADLLSTFTGVLSLQDLGGASSIELAAVRTYVDSLEQPEGGFHGAAWDAASDIEYSFYGLGCLALLS
jgi:geranylgeranyl transferase type-2 subunit beta